MSYIYFPLIFLIFSLILYAVKTSASTFSRTEIMDLFSYKALYPLRFIKSLLPDTEMSTLMTLFSLTKLLTLLTFYTSLLLFFISNNFPYNVKSPLVNVSAIPFLYFLFSGFIISVVTLLALGLCKVMSLNSRKITLKIYAYPAMIPLLLFLPLTYPILLFQKKFSPKKSETIDTKNLVKKHLLELLNFESFKNLDKTKRKLLHSLAHFDDKTCREIMVPRIKLECLQDNSSLFEALTLFIDEGYSRLPVFEKSIDHIKGVLLYKDVFEYTFKRGLQDIETLKKTPISSLVTPILYAPENKKISDLFQVMRARKIHGAIIVNEYGCTEGLVTIEDIFEELIGSEILDEHDEEDELIYKKTHDQGWIVEAGISIIDAEREFGISLPHHAEYETIGGLISTTMGVIPKPGSVVHFDQYELKVLSSNERQILKVKITASAK
ncbi:MAG: hypothetical protein S4CHLAM20_07870 [Chlamydiia bacterium]|nr:hypothetical protein [Chlamydiia bacterium]